MRVRVAAARADIIEKITAKKERGARFEEKVFAIERSIAQNATVVITVSQKKEKEGGY